MHKSTFVKSMYFILILSFLVVFVFSLFEVYTISRFSQKIWTIYKQSIDYSCNYWADQFYIVNKELVRMVDKNNKAEYDALSGASGTDDADISQATAELQNELTNMSVINGNQIVYFAFFPERDLLLTSISYIKYFSNNEAQELKTFLLESTRGNTAEWREARLGSGVYFVHTYEREGSFSGCLISCENVLADVMPSNQRSTVRILNMDGSMFYGGETAETQTEGYFSYARPVRMINKKISIEMPYESFADSTPYLVAMFAAAIVASVLLIVLALRHQSRAIFQPLMKLKLAMEEFSRGNTNVVLDDRQAKNEIGVLYRTFNHMREQIVNLRISIYDAQLEKQRIYTNFLRVQIQPHFYTNILNLTYTLANAGDCDTIRLLTRNMADYFRYILSLNRDFVPLKDELQCVEHYTEVQKVRYQDNFSLKVDCGAEPENELIPPLLIQTFVENSIGHNVMIVPALDVRLTIRKEGERLTIVICDNGVGFSDDVIMKLKNGVDIEENGQHIGIVNVINRLKALYGDEAKLSIDNGERGSCVTISVPRHLTEGGSAD